MSSVIKCDHCQQVIENPFCKSERIQITIGSGYFRDLHTDCFNYLFSTDIRKSEIYPEYLKKEG